MITLASRLPGIQNLRTRRVNQEISVDSPDARRSLSIRISKITGTTGFDRRKAFTDAKKIHSWMVWNLPGETYKALKSLIETDGV